MNRLNQAFEGAKREGRKMLCPFLTAGYPSLEATPELLLAAQQAGADMVEVGIPFSDPVADGPVIQASYTHALARGSTVGKCLAGIAAARKLGVTIPLAAMVSFSIVFKRGTSEFSKACADHGVDGLILPDVPLEEAPAIVDAVREAGLRSTLLVAPTSPAARRAAIARLCDGFVYYLSVSGITGERKALPADIAPNVAELRKVTNVPICVGFGISTAEQVREVTRVADGAIVGSALIRRLAEVEDHPIADQCKAAGSFIKEIAAGLR
ncbi:MAG TPA: tryptophan synthase subunit alpha [Phycisphaerae bacterium]|nr:tryptophan synthase subunit alpha [Phycisphaerae bacterium]